MQEQLYLWLKASAVLLCCLPLVAMQADKPAYQLFRKGGKAATYEQLLQEARKADVILFGELHDNPISHWLQFELARDLQQALGQELVLGAEMFEADNQVLLNEYLQDLISQGSFEKEARLWPNYKTDYKPLVELARDKKLPFIATNVPRRYASLVSKQGLEVLSQLPPESQVFLPPLPVQVEYGLPKYRAMEDMFGGQHGAGGAGAGAKNMIAAQAIKDASMAYRIVQQLGPGKHFLHFNGSYHSDDYEGIYWYLKQLRPELKILTISSVQQPEVKKLEKENEPKADFILAVPASMTKTQ